jgi:hypothetical protein
MHSSKFIPKQLLRFLFFTLMLLTMTHLQTTIWFSFFGYFPSPCFWVPVFVYLMMNRPFPYNFSWLIYIYLIFLTQTAASPTLLFFSILSLWGLILFFQKRFSTLSMADFIFVTSISTFLFPGIYFVYSLMVFQHPHIDLLMNFISFVITLPVIPPILIILKAADGLLKSTPHNDNLVLNL